MNRIDFIAAAMAMSGRAMSTSAPAILRHGAFTRKLPIPAALHGALGSDGRLTYALRAQAGTSALLEGVRTPTWGFNGANLGPTLRLPRGKPVEIAVRNALSVTTTTHWHGALVSGENDGGPHSLIEPGAARTFRFALDQPGATLWYHPHVNDHTGPSVYAGLAGLLLVDDDHDVRLGLPHTYGVDDLPVIIQDRRFNRRGTLAYMTDGSDVMGMKGDRFLVNGCERPHAEVGAQWVRLRVLNGSNARLYNLGFAGNRPFSVIATDAGLLAAPTMQTRLLLAPGERVEIALDLSGDHGRHLTLRSFSGEAIPHLTPMGMEADAYDHTTFDLLELRVGARSGANTEVPARLAEIAPLAPVTGQRARKFTLQANMNAESNGVAQKPIGPGGMSYGVGGLRAFSIDHQYMNMKRINFSIPLGRTEVWEIANATKMAHPIHMHGTSFQILSRNGAPPAPFERGWKDTVLVRRDEKLRLAARFAHRASAANPYMYHCHILEHEDNDMMGQFTVV